MRWWNSAVSARPYPGLGQVRPEAQPIHGLVELCCVWGHVAFTLRDVIRHVTVTFFWHLYVTYLCFVTSDIPWHWPFCDNVHCAKLRSIRLRFVTCTLSSITLCGCTVSRDKIDSIIFKFDLTDEDSWIGCGEVLLEKIFWLFEKKKITGHMDV
jgi:hypothetical protein